MFQGLFLFQCLVNRVLGIVRASMHDQSCFRECACFSAWLTVFQGLCVFQCLVNRVSGIVRVSVHG